MCSLQMLNYKQNSLVSLNSYLNRGLSQFIILIFLLTSFNIKNPSEVSYVKFTYQD